MQFAFIFTIHSLFFLHVILVSRLRRSRFAISFDSFSSFLESGFIASSRRRVSRARIPLCNDEATFWASVMSCQNVESAKEMCLL
jgi:hypothetical protein